MRTGKFISLRESRSYLILLIIVLGAKLAGVLILYHQLNMDSAATYWATVENNVISSEVDQSGRLPYLFLGWDSGWYLSIVMKGYAFSDQSYAFFPGLPLFGWLVNLILQNPILALVTFSNFVGILWVPIYQLVAESYLDKSKALMSTLFYAFFPYVFLFTTVVYSEGLFLFSTLSSWYFFKKKRMLFSMFFASIATIARSPGLLILLPIMVETLRTRKQDRRSFWRRDIFCLLIPFFCFFAWLLYCRITFGDWFAPFNRTLWNDMYSFATFIFNIIPIRGISAMFESLPFVGLVFLLISAFLIYALVRMDKALAVYSVAYFLGVLAFGALASVPRFISFLFPIWLPLTSRLFRVKRARLLILVFCVTFYLIGLFLWYSFLKGDFIA